MSVQYIEVNAEDEGQRLDNYLIRLLKGVPKSHVYRIIRGGEVRVNKKRAQASSRVVAGDRVRIPPIRLTAPKTIVVGEQLTECLQNSVLYEDDDILVVNKPAGIAVHGGSGLSLGMIEALRKVRHDLAYLELVHRLDKETSGCLMLAKKKRVLREIQALLATRLVDKTYWALLHHPWKGKPQITVDAPLEKNTLKSGERMVRVNDAGKASHTRFKLLENYGQACWVEVSPKTGRTHQIRVHSAYLGHPILGDTKYGGEVTIDGMPKKNHRLYLHARAIEFNLDGKQYKFQANLDVHFSELLKKLKSFMR